MQRMKRIISGKDDLLLWAKNQMLCKACALWTSADISISDYVVLKNWWRVFALEQKSQLMVWCLYLKIKREMIELELVFIISFCLFSPAPQRWIGAPSLLSGGVPTLWMEFQSGEVECQVWFLLKENKNNMEEMGRLEGLPKGWTVRGESGWWPGSQPVCVWHLYHNPMVYAWGHNLNDYLQGNKKSLSLV